MSQEDYIDHMGNIMVDDAKVYKTIITDIHQLGGVLQRKKFRSLSIGYTLFMVGIVLSFAIIIATWILKSIQ